MTDKSARLSADPLTEPVAWIIEHAIVLEGLPPDTAYLLGAADIAAWRREIELAFALPPEVIDNGRRRDQTSGGDHEPD